MLEVHAHLNSMMQSDYRKSNHPGYILMSGVMCLKKEGRNKYGIESSAVSHCNKSGESLHGAVQRVLHHCSDRETV